MEPIEVAAAQITVIAPFLLKVIREVRIPTDGDSRFELVSIAITNWVR